VLADALYDAQFVPPDEPVSRTLSRVKRTRRPMAVVRDGGTVVGILTLEDVIEEIVGELEDEHDDPKRRGQFRRLIRRLAPGSQSKPK
jgi:putative hemolysin